MPWGPGQKLSFKYLGAVENLCAGAQGSCPGKIVKVRIEQDISVPTSTFDRS